MKKGFIKLTSRKLFLLVTLALISVITVSAQNGGITGEISTLGPDGNPSNLPGAKIVLTSISKPEKVFTIVSDSTGTYKISAIKAGTYKMEVSLNGFTTFNKRLVIIENQPITEDIRLEIDIISATVDVESDDIQINTTESTVSDQIKPKALQEAPLQSEKFQDALPLIPGVVRGPDGLINVKGAQSSQSATLVGSANGDDPVTGDSAIELPLEAVQSVQVVSNPYSAEYGNFNGGVVQLQTQSGTDKWKFGVNNFLPRLRQRDGGIRGIESATPRVHFGGPIKKNKLFIFQTFEYKFIQTEVESLPELERDKKIESFDSFTRVDYNFSDLHRANVTFAVFPQKLEFVNLNTFNPQETAANFHQRGAMFTLNDQYASSKGAVLQTTFSAKQTDADIFGNSAQPFRIAPETNSGGFFNRQGRNANRYEAQSIYSLPTINFSGEHLFKFGFGFGYTSFDGTNTSNFVEIVRADGTINQLQSYVGNGALDRNKSEFGGFIQDKWSLSPRMTIDFGVRFDRESLSEDFNASPRIGFVIAPFDDSKTTIRGGIGLFYSKIPLNVGTFEQTQDVLIQRFAPDGISLLGQRLFQNMLEEPDIDTPYSVGWNLQFDRELTKRVFLRVGYEQRETKRSFILNPVTGNVLNQGIYQLGNSGNSSYRELLIMTRLRLQPSRDIFISYTRSQAIGDLNTFGNFAGNIRNPILRANENSRLSFDAPNRFLFWGEFGLPYGVTLAPVIDWRQGFPYSRINENQDFIGRRNSGNRLPNFFSTDLQVLKDIFVRFRKKKYKLRVGVKIFNLTNHFNPRDIQNNIDSFAFGGLFNSVSRRIRLKFKVIF